MQPSSCPAVWRSECPGRGIENCRHRRGRALTGGRSGLCPRPAPVARRDRRPGPFSRAGADAQGGSLHRDAGLCQRGRHDVSGNAEHDSRRRRRRRGWTKSWPWRPSKCLVNLRLLHRRDAAQPGRAESGHADARASRSSSAPAPAICSSMTRRRWRRFSPRRRCRSAPTAKTKRRCGPTRRGLRARRTSPITAGFATTRRRSSPRGGRWTWRFGTSIGFTCCTSRPATKPICWPITASLITAEVCPHHLFFNTDDYARLGTLVQMNPSLKTADDNRRLWQALLDGRIQVIATDHAPHTLEEKRKPYSPGHGGSPSGLPAVENSLALMLNEVHPRPLHDRASRPLDVRRPGPRVGHRRQGPDRSRLRRRPGAGRSATRSATIRNDEQETKIALVALARRQRSPAGRCAPGSWARKSFATARSTTPSAAAKPSSTTPAAATGDLSQLTTDHGLLTKPNERSTFLATSDPPLHAHPGCDCPDGRARSSCDLRCGPSWSELPPETKAAFHEQVRSRWAKFVMLATLLILVSGVTNLAMAARLHIRREAVRHVIPHAGWDQVPAGIAHFLHRGSPDGAAATWPNGCRPMPNSG